MFFTVIWNQVRSKAASHLPAPWKKYHQWDQWVKRGNLYIALNSTRGEKKKILYKSLHIFMLIGRKFPGKDPQLGSTRQGHGKSSGGHQGSASREQTQSCGDPGSSKFPPGNQGNFMDLLSLKSQLNTTGWGNQAWGEDPSSRETGAESRLFSKLCSLFWARKLNLSIEKKKTNNKPGLV